MIKKRMIISLSVVLALVISILGVLRFESLRTQAAQDVDPSKCVTFAQFKATHDIPDTTMFVGTHLIVMESATEEIWQLAEDSIAASNQTRIFYKSELDGGAWYDVTSADSVSFINGDEEYVEYQVPEPGTPQAMIGNVEDLMSDLLVEYYTFDYGITRRAIDDGRHCIFDGENPYYDLYHLDELSEMKSQYDIIKSRNNDKSKMDKFYLEELGKFYNRDLRNETCRTCDTQLYALQDVFDELSSRDMKQEADVVYKLMAKLDHQRRAEIFGQLVEVYKEPEPAESQDDGASGGGGTKSWLKRLIEKVKEIQRRQNGTTESGGTGDTGAATEDEEGSSILSDLFDRCNGTNVQIEDQDEFITNYDLTDAIGEGISNCQTSYDSHSTNVLIKEGGWVIDELIYAAASNIIQNAPGGVGAVETDLTRLGHLFNIDEDVVVNQEEERTIIENELMAEVIQKFKSGASESVPTEYIQLKNSGEVSDSVLTKILKDLETILEDKRMELQALITSYTNRISIDDGLSFTEDRINDTDDMKGNVSTSDFGARALDVVNKHYVWLFKKHAELYDKSGKESDLERMMREAQELLDAINKALSENRLDDARNLNAQRDHLLDQIDGIMDNLKENAQSASDLAQLNSMTDGEDGANNLEDMIDQIVEDVNSGKTDLETAGDILGTLGATDAMAQLGIVDANGNAIGPGDGTLSGDGTGTGTGTGADGANSQAGILARLEGLIGDLASASDQELGAAIRAMELWYRDGSDVAGDVASTLAARAKQRSGYKYLYNKYRESSTQGATNRVELVNLETLADVAGYRYIYDNNNTVATLSLNAQRIYVFAVGNNRVMRNVGGRETLKEIGTLSTSVKFFKAPYADISCAKTYFNCTACDITKANYGLCITDNMEKRAQELYNQLKG